MSVCTIKKEDLANVYYRLRSQVHNTPLITSTILNNLSGADIFFKCESFQRTGSFKIRGATNAILSLNEKEREKGVVTHSSGNFAQALAFAASNQGIKSWIVMPENAPKTKMDAVANYGGNIVLCASTQQAREESAQKIVNDLGANFIHPYNQKEVIVGQATCAMEIIEKQSNLDYLIVPVGGGGLISGAALATYYFSAHTKVIGAEPLEANDAYLSLQKGEIVPQTNPKTMADGLRTSLGSLTFPIIKELVSEIITVTEEEIIDAMKLFWTRTKIIIEPSSAVALAAVLKTKKTFTGRKVGIILSGGNVDLTNLPF
jgi:threonine dehydratase